MTHHRLSLATSLCLLFCAIGLSQAQSNLTPALIEEIENQFDMDTHARAMQNALTSVSIKDLSENRQVLADHNTTFSHKIETKGISNQKSSGRCWMFAGFNTLRPVILKNLEQDSFEFSHIYLQFWDKFEKANTCSIWWSTRSTCLSRSWTCWKSRPRNYLYGIPCGSLFDVRRA